MIDLYYWTTPNGHKITMFLEEAGLPYRIVPVHIGRGEQFKPDFLRISPNNKMPAIVDHAPADGGEPLAVPAHAADANFAKDNPGFSIGLFVLLIGVLWRCNRLGLPVWAILLAILSSSGRGGGGGGGGGGGFRVGGGGFGGGGASGGW